MFLGGRKPIFFEMNVAPFLCWVLVYTLSSLSYAGKPGESHEQARELIQQAMDNWRGLSSYSEMTMVIHRASWERRMSMRAWTQGDKQSLVRVSKPKKDAGNATLVIDESMWSFSPKINRVIKVPSSMMNQSWMGSDFSNKDISRSTEIIDSYQHTLEKRETVGEHTHYTIVSIPNEDAPVVWGKEVLVVRDDYVLLEQQYWDQDGELVKVMKATEVGPMGGRNIAIKMRMFDVDQKDEWTEMIHHSVNFDVDLPKGVFTLSNLRNPRQ